MSRPQGMHPHLRRGLALSLLFAAALVAGGASMGRNHSLAASQKSGGPTIHTGSADSVVVFPLQTYYHSGSSSTWVLYDDSFEADTVAGRRYIVEVVNGGANGVRLFINGQEFIGASEFGSTSSRILREIDVEHGTNGISTMVKGVGSSYVNVRVVRVWDPTFVVHGPTTFTYTNGSPQIDTFSISAAAKPPYALRAINGSPAGTNRLTNATLWLNGSSVLSSSDLGTGIATITKTVTLAGTNNRDSLQNQSGSGTKIALRYTATDSTAPVIALSNPVADTTRTTASSILFTGRVTDQTAGTITVGSVGTVATPDTFTLALNMPTTATYRVPITAMNSARLMTSLDRTVIRDVLAPTITPWRPSHDTAFVASADTFTIVGALADTTTTALTIDGDTVLVGSGRQVGFTHLYHLDPGQNGVLLRATDALGNQTQFKLWIRRSPYADTLIDADVDASAATTTGVRDFKESVEFLYTAGSPLQTGVVTDSISTARASVVRGWVVGRDASALPGVAVSVLGHPEFGSGRSREDGAYDLVVNGGRDLTLRFQKPGYLESQRRVRAPVNDYAIVDSVGMVGKSAKSTVVDLGSGQFSRSRLATDANGDRDVRILFKPGTTAKVFKPNGDSATFSSGVRARVSEITIGPMGTIAMPATLPPGSAYGYCADFSLVEADSIAEALGAGALDTRFSQPVAAYVRNFLHMPVGSFMPNGTYDGTTGQWKPDTDAVVIKILGFSASGDTARVDLDGDGVAADSAQLAAHHFDGFELTHLRQQFSAGDSLMRTLVTHFSERDLNPPEYPKEPPLTLGQKIKSAILWLFGCTTEADGSIIECENCVLGESVPITGTPFALNYRSYRASGDSAIRTLRVPLFGDSVPSNVTGVIVHMDVAGKRYRATDYTPAAYDSVIFVWDGKDAYGRVVEGAVNAHVSVGYQSLASLALGSGGPSFANPAATNSVNWTGPGERAAPQTSWMHTTVALGAPSCATDGLGGWMLSEHHFYDPHGEGALYLGSGKVVLGSEQHPIVNYVAGCITQSTCPAPGTSDVALRSLLEPHDLAVGPDGVLYVADLHTNSIYKMLPGDSMISRVAGTGSTGHYVDNVAATSSPLHSPRRLALGPDGSIYFVMDLEPNTVADADSFPRVCRITPDGVIHRLTSKSPAPFPYIGDGDGGSALRATIGEARAIAVAPDGSVFIGDYGASSNNRVRRIGPDGIITTYAGGLGLSESDTPSPATSIGLSGIDALALDRNGTLYIAEMGSHKVKQVSRSGIMSTLMSGANFFPADLEFGPDGCLYVNSLLRCGLFFGDSCSRIYKRDPDGNVTVYAGRRDGRAVTAGAYATAMSLDPDGLAIGPDGDLYVTESYDKVLRIHNPFPTYLTGTFTIASPDGSEFYAFDRLGRHLWTRDALTGAVRYKFNYDGSSRLKSIYDANGDSTVISRSGSTITIVAPYEQTTTLGLNGGQLHTITDPASQQIVLDTPGDGLLRSYTDAKNQTHDMTYNGQGRLQVDADPEGGSQTLTSGAGLNRRHVERTTALGRTTSYDVLVSSDGAQQHYTTGPEGLTTLSSSEPHGVTRTLLPTGVVISDSVGPNGNPTIGMIAPTLARTATRMPSGLSRLTDIVETASPLMGSPGGSGTWSRQVSVNSRTPHVTSLAVTGTPATGTLLKVSPVGRRDSTVIDSVGRPSSVSISGLATLNLSYDGRGKLIAASRGNQRMSYGYDGLGRLATLRDTLQRMITLGYDDADRVNLVTLPDSRQIQIGHDENGNVESVTPPGGHEHAFDYSGVDQVLHYTPPAVTGVGSPATTYTYNDDQQLTRITKPDGSVISLGYNSTSGRLDSLTVARGRSVFNYKSATGQLDSLSSPDTVSIHYGYDGDLPLSETWTGRLPGVSSIAVSRTFTPQFQESTQTVGSTSPVTFSHDLDGLLIGAGPLSLHRSAQSGLVDSTQVSNLTSSQDYDAVGNLANLRYALNGTTIFLQSMQRDGIGRISALSEYSFGASRIYAYRYDLGGWLYGVTLAGDTIAVYRYDANGNRTSFWNPQTGDTATATYDEQDRMLRYKNTRYEYTPSGFLSRATDAGVTRYSYDELGALIKVALPSGDSITYSVDALGRRVGRRYNGAWTKGWVYSGRLHALGETDSVGGMLNRYIYGHERHTPALVQRSDSVYRVVVDQLGSIRGVVNASSGTVLQRTDFDAWGVTTFVVGGDIQGLGFCGGLGDPATGLTKFGARDYAPNIGRWTAQDPAGFVDHGVSLYAYALNDPISHIDPTGLETDLTKLVGWPNYYQNWGGPSWTNGSRVWKENENFPHLPGQDGYVPPTNKRDELYRQHDVDLMHCEIITDRVDQEKCRREADIDLAMKIWQFEGNAGCWPQRPIEFGIFLVPVSPNSRYWGKRH